MADTYPSFLALLSSLRESLEQLTALTLRKAEAAAKDDLMALDEIMKQEQALGLAFRGMEQNREKLLRQLGCGPACRNTFPRPIRRRPGRPLPPCKASIRTTAATQAPPAPF